MIDKIISHQYFNIFLRIAIILILATILRIITGFYFKRAKQKISKNSTEEIKRVQQTRFTLLRKITSAGIYLITIILVLGQIPGFKEISYSLLAGAGILALILGFAAQKALSNIISGISIALYGPFRVGDKLKAFEEYGEVEDINLRHTVIRTWDNKRLVVPNALMDDKEVINFSLKGEKVLWTLSMGISYDSDIDKAKKIMLKKAKTHPSNLEFEENKDGEKVKQEPYTRVVDWADSAVVIKLYFWCEDAWKAWGMGFDLLEQIKKEFDKQGIEIPFPYRTLVYKKDLKKK